MVETDRLRDSLTLERYLVLQKDTCNSVSTCHRREKSAETHRVICCVSFGRHCKMLPSLSHRPVLSLKPDRHDHLLHECDGSTEELGGGMPCKLWDDQPFYMLLFLWSEGGLERSLSTFQVYQELCSSPRERRRTGVRRKASQKRRKASPVSWQDVQGPGSSFP